MTGGSGSCCHRGAAPRVLAFCCASALVESQVLLQIPIVHPGIGLAYIFIQGIGIAAIDVLAEHPP